MGMASKKTAPYLWQRVKDGDETRGQHYATLVKAAMEIADREGLEAVTMRSVAQATGSGTMSLYRYVSGKDDLLDLLVDAGYGEIPLPKKPHGWRDTLERVAEDSRRVLKQHPWLAPLLSRRATLGPNYVQWLECLLAATESAHWGMRTQARMIGAVWAYVTGFVVHELGELEPERKAGKHQREPGARYVAELLAREQHPLLKKFLESDAGQPSTKEFRVGLQFVLDGIAAKYGE